jgi:TetR/AcrR family transcriptional repressor of nem operon
MRVSREQASRNREAVVQTAARLFREHGVGGVGIADLMHATGLTHGGFYKQFVSKAELMVEATDRAMAENRENLGDRKGGDGHVDLPRIAAGYLSKRHRDASGQGCAFAALAAEAARGGAELKDAFTRGLLAHRDLLQPGVAGKDAAERSKQTLLILSTMVGALLLARAVNDEALSAEILAAASASVAAKAGQDPLGTMRARQPVVRTSAKGRRRGNA